MSVTSDNPPNDDARPNPPRFWWLKRIGAATGVLIVGLVVLRLWWGWEADRRLQAKIAEYRAAGEPVLIEDFQHPPVPDEENAAYFLVKAAEAIEFPTDLSESLVDYFAHPEALDKYSAESSKLMEANAEVLALVREARSRERVDWNLRLTSPVINMLLPQLRPQRDLGKLLTVAAHHEHIAGNDSAAVEKLRDLVFQANAIGRMPGSMISHLSAVAVTSLSAEAVESIAPNLHIAGGAHPPRPGEPATREQVRTLMQELLNDSPIREGWRQAMLEERLYHLDCVDLLVDGTWGPRALGLPGVGWKALRPVVTPSLQLEALEMLRYSSRIMEAGLKSNYQVARGVEPCYPTFLTGIERKSHFLSAYLIPDFRRACELHYRTLAIGRMAATVLAIRLYEIDQGVRPNSLDKLVPQYLDSVPIDVLADDGRPIGYLPSAPKPVLYCVGSDGKDDGGAYAMKDADTVDMNALDLVIFLDDDRPRGEPELSAEEPGAEKAEIDQGEEVRDGGKPDQDQGGGD